MNPQPMEFHPLEDRDIRNFPNRYRGYDGEIYRAPVFRIFSVANGKPFLPQWYLDMGDGELSFLGRKEYYTSNHELISEAREVIRRSTQLVDEPLFEIVREELPEPWG